MSLSVAVCAFICSFTAPSAPSFIHFSELTTSSVNMSWGEPKHPNGIIEGYRLIYEPCTPIDGEKLKPVSWDILHLIYRECRLDLHLVLFTKALSQNQSKLLFSSVKEKHVIDGIL